ncbi:hypothetical protein BO83DRAFT_395900 [Aspergillus eucalypticola CBS 122712]|uniref:Uncharacterized protein n=1 Tax=Aspergillus eucalypticola (strain CBS 122712 / IBT 29274) TaxID=1448314 RepID=A0A317W373_ASPEC|nr:uncharacterized protein BO83DRAFT_395900 [Aspergillus eucalypticola CBS 122712]PWY81004.1 hypothetical protein BO83DRAFT_395900 [Aspergillus eucalypticola CBS 122712]
MRKLRYATAHLHRSLCFSWAETYHQLCSFSKVLEGLRKLVLFAWNKPLAGPRGFRPAVNQGVSWMERINAPTVPIDYLHPSGGLQAPGSSRPPSFHRPSGVTHDQGRDAIPPDQTPADDDILALQAGLDETGSARRIFERSQTNGKPQLALVSPEAAFPPANNFHRISGFWNGKVKGTGLDCLTSAPADECRRALVTRFDDSRSTTGSLVVSGWVNRDRGAGLRMAEEKLNSRQWEITQAATRYVLGLFGGQGGESSHVFVKRDAQAGSTEGRSWMDEDERDSR